MGQTAADQLRQIILPDLIKLVGDIKVQRVSAESVAAYLRRQQLLFDESMLHSMFDEADFKHEGSLPVGPLTGAIQGRYLTGSSALQSARSLLDFFPSKQSIIWIQVSKEKARPG